MIHNGQHTQMNVRMPQHPATICPIDCAVIPATADRSGIASSAGCAQSSAQVSVTGVVDCSISECLGESAAGTHESSHPRRGLINLSGMSKEPPMRPWANPPGLFVPQTHNPVGWNTPELSPGPGVDGVVGSF